MGYLKEQIATLNRVIDEKDDMIARLQEREPYGAAIDGPPIQVLKRENEKLLDQVDKLSKANSRLSRGITPEKDHSRNDPTISHMQDQISELRSDNDRLSNLLRRNQINYLDPLEDSLRYEWIISRKSLNTVNRGGGGFSNNSFDGPNRIRNHSPFNNLQRYK